MVAAVLGGFPCSYSGFSWLNGPLPSLAIVAASLLSRFASQQILVHSAKNSERSGFLAELSKWSSG